MQNIVRTTIRIRKDLLDLSKLLALQKGVSMQQVINEMLEYGFDQLPKKKSRREIMDEIDRMREEIYQKHGYINTQELVDANKRDQQESVDRILGRVYKTKKK